MRRATAILVLATAFALGSGRALAGPVDCADYGAGMRWLTRAEFEFATSDADVAIQGDHAYVAAYRLAVVDLAEPDHPAVTHVSYAGWAAPSCVAVDGSLLVAGFENLGVQIYTLGSPGFPTLRAQHGLSGTVRGVALLGDHLYVARQSDGVTIIELSDPAAPVVVGTLAVATANGVTIANGQLVIDESTRFEVYQLDDPAAPTLRYQWNHGVIDIESRGDRLYVARGLDGIALFRANSFGGYQFLGTYSPGGYVPHVTGEGDLVYMVHANSILCLEAPDSGGWTELDRLVTGDEPDRLAFHGGLAYAAAEQSLDVYDLSQPGGVNDLVGSATNGIMDRLEVVATRGGFAYATGLDVNLAHRFDVFDLGDPAAPVLVDEIVLGDDGAHAIALTDTLAYVATGTGLAIVDIADPAGIALVAQTESDQSTMDVVRAGDLLVTAERYDGLVIYSIAADPLAPQFVGRYSDPSLDVQAVAIRDQLAVAFTADRELITVDVSDPAAPVRLGEIGGLFAPDFLRIAIAGDHVYAAGTYRVWIVDVANPGAPQLAAELETPALVRDVAVRDQTLYAALGTAGLLVADVTVPSQVGVLGSLAVTTRADGLALGDDLVLLVGDAHLDLAPLQCPAVTPAPGPLPTPALTLDARPNPFNPATTVHYALPAAARVELAVYDVAGRRVRTLVDGERKKAGRHALRWDGRDDDGRALASGVYLARLRAGAARGVSKLALVR